MNTNQSTTHNGLSSNVRNDFNHKDLVTQIDRLSIDQDRRKFPRYRRFRLENSLMSHLSGVLKMEDLSNFGAFANALAPVTRAIIDCEDDEMGRPTFHYKVAFMVIYDFLDKHEVLYDEGSHWSLFNVLRRAVISPDSKSYESILYLLANLFILTGPLIYMRRRSLRLLSDVLDSIPSSQSHKLDNLHALTCNCLVWSFSRMAKWDAVEESIWRNALHVVQPHLTADIVPTLVGHLIDNEDPSTSTAEPHPGVKLASMVIYSLVIDEDSQRRVVATDILRQLLVGGYPGAWPDASLHLVNCFSKMDALINDASTSHLQDLAHQSIALRTLSFDEVDTSWEYLASAWYSFARTETLVAHHSVEGIELPHDIVEMWRVLLRDVNDAEKFFVDCLCNIHIARIIELGQQKDQSHRQATEDFFKEIQFATQLWLVASDELERPVRTAVAEAILQKVFDHRDIYVTFSGRSEKKWRTFVEELVFCDPERALLAANNTGIGISNRALLQQQIWSDLVHYTVLEDIALRGTKTYFSVSELVAFLDFPNRVCFPRVDEYVRLLWKTLLHKTLLVAKERRKAELVFRCMEKTAMKLGVHTPGRENCSDNEREPEVNQRMHSGTRGRTRFKKW